MGVGSVSPATRREDHDDGSGIPEVGRALEIREKLRQGKLLRQRRRGDGGQWGGS
jgi:hypothetical protein